MSLKRLIFFPALLAISNAGCGYDNADENVTSTLPTTSEQAKKAEAVVKSYYGYIADKKYKSAWASLSPEAQKKFGSYRQWVKSKRALATISEIKPGARVVTADEATVGVTYTATVNDVCGSKVNKKFKGNLSLSIISILASLESPTSGSAKVFGKDCAKPAYRGNSIIRTCLC